MLAHTWNESVGVRSNSSTGPPSHFHTVLQSWIKTCCLIHPFIHGHSFSVSGIVSWTMANRCHVFIANFVGHEPPSEVLQAYLLPLNAGIGG